MSPIGKRKREEPRPAITRAAAASAVLSISANTHSTQTRIPRGGARGAALLAAIGGKSTQPPIDTSDNHTTTTEQASGDAVPVAIKTTTTTTQLPPNPLLKQPLPQHLALLHSTFCALHTVYDMMRKRGLRTTYENMKQPIEEACTKRFTMTHLAQLTTLLPEAMTLEWIKVAASAQSQRLEPALLITLKPVAPATDLIGLRDEVYAALAQHLLDSYRQHVAAKKVNTVAGDDNNQVLEKPITSTRVIKAPFTQFAAPFPEGAPDIEPAELPPHPTKLTTIITTLQPGVVGRGTRPSNRKNNEMDVNNLTVDYKTQPELGSSRKKSKKAVDKLDSPQESCGGGGGRPPLPPLPAGGRRGNSNRLQRRLSFSNADKEKLLASMPEELRRRSVDGIISYDSLKVLEANEAEHNLISGNAAKAQRAINAALANLPKCFSRIQRIFGSRGPNAMKLNDMIKRIKEGGAENVSEAEIKSQIEALAMHAPELLQLKPWGSCGTPAVWINRKCSFNAVAVKLKAVAEGRFKQ